MKGALLQLGNGHAFAVRVTESPQEEAAGVNALGPRAALLFSGPGPVDMTRTRWPLDLVWLMPADGAYRVVAVERAQPGTYGQGIRRASTSRLLEVPASWGLRVAPGDVARVMVVASLPASAPA